VKRLRRSRGGFSLTEVLMATGILGVGMTMVASVFPVAIDQSRQSRDATLAALSARSVAAGMRAMRPEVTEWCRVNDPSTKTAMLPNAGLPRDIRAYNPNAFLYEPRGGTSTGTTKSQREYGELNDVGDLWDLGAYVPVVFATPMDSDPGGREVEGPWRITIVVYKSRGRTPGPLAGFTTEIPLESWADGNTCKAGEYIMDWEPNSSDNHRGEAYKVSFASGGTRVATSDDEVYPAGMPTGSSGSGRTSTSGAAVADRLVSTSGTSNSTTEWLALPGAVAVYHTILGD